MSRIPTTALGADSATDGVEAYRASAVPRRAVRGRRHAAPDRRGPRRAAAAPRPDGLIEAGRSRDTIFMQQGITFETPAAAAQPANGRSPLDLVPRVLTAASGRYQTRACAANPRAQPFVDDVYHAREIVRAESCRGRARGRLLALRPRRPRRPSPGAASTRTSAGCDLVRGGDGVGRSSRTTSERRPASPTSSRTVRDGPPVPELFAGYRVRPVDNYPSLLLDALCSVAPSAEGSRRSSYGRPARRTRATSSTPSSPRQMGVELVEASDLVVRDDVCTSARPRASARARDLPSARRRLRRPARVPTRLAAWRAGSRSRLSRGHVAIATRSAPGSADDKAVYRFVPEMIRFYLGEEPILPLQRPIGTTSPPSWPGRFHDQKHTKDREPMRCTCWTAPLLPGSCTPGTSAERWPR